jgi:two-component system response regulator (stage 0 sporulation protein F)
MDAPRALITQWMKDGSILLAQLLDDHSRAAATLEEVQRECAKLRADLTAIREENDRFRKERSEVVTAIATVLSTATAVLRRFPDAPTIVTVTPVTAAGVSPAQVESGAAAPAPVPPPTPTASLPPGSPGSPGPPRGTTPRRVLVVDDEESFRSLVATYLGGQGYEVTTAASGEEALVLLEKSPPQLVLLDLRMPGIGGMQALRSIKVLYPDLCVLMVTAEGDRSVAQEALVLGATDYLKKPFDLDYLDAVLQIYMPVTYARSVSVRSAMPATEQSKAVIPTSPPPKNPVSLALTPARRPG